VKADLPALGWDNRWAEELALLGDPTLFPARVIFASHGIFRVSDGRGFPAVLAGSFGRPSKEGRRIGEGPGEAETPVTGDWVACSPPSGDGPRVIRALLPRRSVLSRKSPGVSSRPQTLAANVDTVFIVNALDSDFSPRRIERYLALAWEGGASPVVVLNKTDLCPDFPAALARAGEAAPGAEVLAVCGASGAGVEELRRFLAPGKTACLLGSSGVGKSTLVNLLLGREAQATREVREEDGKGRHATASREMFLLPGGGLLLDTPGLREVGLEGGEGLAAVFPEIAALAAGCRFRDCAHAGEPGCAVVDGVAEGRIAPERLESWRRLARESAFQRSRSNEQAQRERKKKEKIISRAIKGIYKLKGR
jgi:ribosome biogenesis GTPase